MKGLFIAFMLLQRSKGDEVKDLISCCPYPLSPCSIQHGCCIQLCTAMDPGLELRGLSDVGSDGCCPQDDPCGEKVESGNCILCDCEALGEYDDLFDTLRSSFDVSENDTVGTGLNGLERESGKGFDDPDDHPKSRSTGLELFGLVFENLGKNSSNNTGEIGLRSSLGNNDFAFDKIEEVTPLDEGGELSYLLQCCPSPSEPCNVQHTCCIQLCSALEPGLRVRGALDVGSDGCCPESDPCGEQLESGNCIHCNCNYDYYDTEPLGDSLRSSFSLNSDDSDYKDYGFERESGKGFEGIEVKVGITSNGLDRETGEFFDRVNRDSGPATTEDVSEEDGSGIKDIDPQTEYANSGNAPLNFKLSMIMIIVTHIYGTF